MSDDIHGNIKIIHGDVRRHSRKYKNHSRRCQNHEHFNGRFAEQSVHSVSFRHDWVNLDKSIDILDHPYEERVVKFDSQVISAKCKEQSAKSKVHSCGMLSTTNPSPPNKEKS